MEDFEFDKAMKIARSRNRISISAEVMGKLGRKVKVNIPVNEKTPEQEERIKSIVDKCFLFSSVDANDLNVILKAFSFREAKSGDVLINQGDDGNELFLIESGTAEFTKKTSMSDDVEFLCTMSDGQYFGELALMYNAPRAATVVAKTDMRLWTLDRVTFNHIVKTSVVKKREKYDSLLRGVSLLSKLCAYDRCRLSDALVEKKFNNGDNIINEGDSGTSLFMLMKGHAEAYCQGKLVKSYKEGDYFGEIALVKQTPRASTVVARGDVVVCELERESVVNLLGPLEEALSNNIREYKKVLAELGINNPHLK